MFNFDQKLIDIDKIKLNPFNPRIGKANNMEFNGPELSQDNVTSAIKDILLGEDDGGIENISDKDGFRALQKSIQSIGTITNPIIIQKLTAKEENFEYLVVEGNTRLTIYRELHNNYSNTNEYDGKKWKFIPCHILNDTNKELYHKIQLTAHIVGPKSWDPYCRAKYLYELKQSGDLNVDFIQVAEMCGGSTRKAVIDNQIEAYRHMQKWKDLDMSGRLEYAPKEFQKFFQYQMRKPRLEDVGIDEDEFLDHVSKNRIYRAADVRKLHKIWQDPTVDPNQTSRKIFLESNSNYAIQNYEELERRHQRVENNNIINLARNLSTEISKLSDPEDKFEFVQANSENLDILTDLKSTVIDFVDDLIDIHKHSSEI